MMLDNGHSAYQLNQTNVWSNFTVPDPIQLNKLFKDTFIITSHDSQNSCTLINIDPVNGFRNKVRIDTENQKVYSACLLNSGI